MDLTVNESQVVVELRRTRVAELSQLAAKFDLSTKTVHRALIKAGYFTSINQNARFVTLKDVPQFDTLGLWSFKQIHFSKHGNLQKTLEKLIERAPAGWTLRELEELVGTQVHNHISQLIREGTVGRFLLGRNAVYVAVHGRDAKRQEIRRRAMQQSMVQAVTRTNSTRPLPPGFDALAIIHVLVALLQTPSASPASVARSLQAKNVSIRADQIRDIVEFYELKKTTRGS